MHHIASATGSTAYTFSSIPQTYSHLQFRITGRSTSGAAYSTIYSGFNSDIFSNPNYSNHLIAGNGSSNVFIGQASVNQINISQFVWNAVTANAQGSFIIDIPDYTNTSRNKVMKYVGGWDGNGDGRAVIGSSMWLNTAAINTVTFTPDGGFTTSTRIDLYGITTNPTATGA